MQLALQSATVLKVFNCLKRPWFVPYSPLFCGERLSLDKSTFVDPSGATYAWYWHNTAIWWIYMMAEYIQWWLPGWWWLVSQPASSLISTSVWQIQFLGPNMNTNIFGSTFFGPYKYKYIWVDFFWQTTNTRIFGYRFLDKYKFKYNRAYQKWGIWIQILSHSK